jgi:hypothetical protein
MSSPKATRQRKLFRGVTSNAEVKETGSVKSGNLKDN